MKNLYNYIYITINKINGKCYIGSHSSKYEIDNYLGSGNLIVSAIKKYGKQNFLKIKLKSFDKILEARLAEGIYVEKFDTITPNGYNISPAGGCNFKDGIASEETRKKLSKIQKGRKHTKEHNKNVGLSLRGKKQNPQIAINAWITRRKLGKDIPWNKGKKDCYTTETIEKFKYIAKNRVITEETRKKKSKSMKGKNKGKKRGMDGKSNYDIWLEKYGKEEADIRYKNWIKAISHPKKKK